MDPPGELKASNQHIKRLRRLISSRKARSTERVFVIEGRALVTEAVSSPSVAVESLFLAAAEESGLADVVSEASRRGIAVHRAATGVLDAVLDPVQPQPVAAIVTARPALLDELPPAKPSLLLVEVRDPGNLGTLIRTAEASGMGGVIVAGSSVDVANPKSVRASAGALMRLPVVVAPDVDELLRTLDGLGRGVAATVIDPEATAYDEVVLDDLIIALGSEAHGLPPRVIERASQRLTIPLAGPTESLNVAAAGAIIAFEALRQRRTARRSGPNPSPTSS